MPPAGGIFGALLILDKLLLLCYYNQDALAKVWLFKSPCGSYFIERGVCHYECKHSDDKPQRDKR